MPISYSPDTSSAIIFPKVESEIKKKKKATIM